MYEVEVKVRADHDEVSGALDELGARRGDRVVQRDTYYDAPHRDFAETDEALRVRRVESASGDEQRVTYKGPLVDDASKTRLEHETAVGDGDTADAILRGLGFEPVATVTKRRVEYRLDGYTVTLDSVEGLGEFVEVEREAAEADIEAVRDGARDLLSTLGVDPASHLRTSYLGLLFADEA